MSLQEAMALTTRLLSQAQALAAITARARLIDSGDPGDPALRDQLDRVADCLDARQIFDDLTPSERAIVTAFARSYLRQAMDLVEEPARPSAWTHTDPALLQAQGSASRIVASLIAGAGLGRADARILDVGTGVAGLAMAFCETFPRATVVGLDPWEPALALARANVEAAGLSSRITLLSSAIQTFKDEDGFDLVWLPAFFLPEAVLDNALRAVLRATRSGGTVVVGTFESPEDPLAAAIDSLVTVRSGGTPLSPADAIRRLEETGFADVAEAPRTWQAPLRLAVGRRA